MQHIASQTSGEGVIMAVDQRSEIENWGVKTNQLQDLNQNVDGGVGGGV